MSLADLTRNSFQSGISATQWIALCKLYIEKNNFIQNSVDVGSSLCNSLISLYRNYAGDPALQEYLMCALKEGIFSTAAFVSSFLQAARSPELHNTATLDVLCRAALDAHYFSGRPPVGSIVPLQESQIVVLGTVQDALALLRIAYALPTTQFHHLINSASELVILLLSCVHDISQISTAQAMVHFADASDMLHTLRLSPAVRQVLDTFVLSLSILIGDDAKAAREAQMMHTIHLTLGKGDILGPNSDSDIVTCSLLLNALVVGRANDFGSGNASKAITLLLTTLRWTSWTPTVFYTQILVAAFACISQSVSHGMGNHSFSLWKFFVFGRLPHLLLSLEKVLVSHGNTESEQRSALQAAVTSVLQRTELIRRCENIASQSTGSISGNEDTETPRPFIRDFLHHLLTVGMIDNAFAVSLDSMIANDNPILVVTEAREVGMELEPYLDSKLNTETGPEDVKSLLNRIRRDISSHSTFSQIIEKRFLNHSQAFDAEHLSQLCKLLYEYDIALDIVSLHAPISNLIFYALEFLISYDFETVGDPQTAINHVGDVVLFLQATTTRFQLLKQSFKMGDKSLQADFLYSPATVYHVDDLSGEDAAAFAAWFKALFDSNSEGIDDAILRSTKPETLLRISSTLFAHALAARAEGRMEEEVLQNGVSYFRSPLLSWTLVGVAKSLAVYLQHNLLMSPIHMEVLLDLILSPSCPRPVICLSSSIILKMSILPKASLMSFPRIADVARMRSQALKSLELSEDGLRSSSRMQVTGRDYSTQAIRDALAAARTGKPPRINIDRCLLMTPPSKFLHMLWSDLSIAASLGEMEACRRIGLFILTTPHSSVPLLPIFIHTVLPTLISTVERRQPPEKTMNIELLVAIISSSLTAALHLEVALQTVCNERKYVLGQSSASMARKLASNLRAKKYDPAETGMTIAQRLASSPSFVTNFPVFILELE